MKKNNNELLIIITLVALFCTNAFAQVQLDRDYTQDDLDRLRKRVAEKEQQYERNREASALLNKEYKIENNITDADEELTARSKQLAKELRKIEDLESELEAIDDRREEQRLQKKISKLYQQYNRSMQKIQADKTALAVKKERAEALKQASQQQQDKQSLSETELIEQVLKKEK